MPDVIELFTANTAARHLLSPELDDFLRGRPGNDIWCRFRPGQDSAAQVPLELLAEERREPLAR